MMLGIAVRGGNNRLSTAPGVGVAGFGRDPGLAVSASDPATHCALTRTRPPHAGPDDIRTSMRSGKALREKEDR